MRQFYLFYSREADFFHQLGGKLEDENITTSGAELRIPKDKRVGIFHQPGGEFAVHPIFQIPWRHHVEIFTKCKSVKEAMFYVQKTLKNGWSRAVLMNFIEAGLWERQGKAVNNFDRLLPDVQSDLAKETLNFRPLYTLNIMFCLSCQSKKKPRPFQGEVYRWWQEAA